MVHESHGIGKFLGIEQLAVQGVKKDYLKVKYAGEDMLYIPVDQLGYIAEVRRRRRCDTETQQALRQRVETDEGEGQKGRDRYGGGAHKGVGGAHEGKRSCLFSRYGLAEGVRGQFSLYRDGRSAPVRRGDKEGHEKESPMDRLLCGDVGFGKTEVAARALFKCVADGKQLRCWCLRRYWPISITIRSRTGSKSSLSGWR